MCSMYKGKLTRINPKFFKNPQHYLYAKIIHSVRSEKQFLLFLYDFNVWETPIWWSLLRIICSPIRKDFTIVFIRITFLLLFYRQKIQVHWIKQQKYKAFKHHSLLSPSYACEHAYASSPALLTLKKTDSKKEEFSSSFTPRWGRAPIYLPRSMCALHALATPHKLHPSPQYGT